MLYLEARSLLATRAAGSQGSQNGSISCIALPESLPDGVRAVTAENLIAMLLGMEVASGNDALASHSDIRKAAKLMLQFIPGTDFITSGYGAIPRSDNMFGGGNFDVSELDDWHVLQRDMRDRRRHHARERGARARRCASARRRALQAVFAGLGFPPIEDDEMQAAIGAYGSEDMPDRDRVADIEAAQRLLERNRSPCST